MEVTSYTPGTPSWVELATTDPEAAKRFYGALFGWEFRDEPAGDGVYTMCLLNGHSVAGLMELGPDQRTAGVPPHWATYITVPSVEDAAAKAAQAGGTVLAPPFDVMDAGRMTVVQDPAGAIVSLWEPKNHIGATLVNEPGTFCWNELQVHDMAAAEAFYRQVLGVDAATTQMPEGPYTVFTVDGRSVAGMMQIQESWGPVPPHWDVYFAVADTDAFLMQAQAAGGTVHVPAMDIPDVGRFAGVTDPQGAMLYVLQM